MPRKKTTETSKRINQTAAMNPKEFLGSSFTTKAQEFLSLESGCDNFQLVYQTAVNKYERLLDAIKEQPSSDMCEMEEEEVWHELMVQVNVKKNKMPTETRLHRLPKLELSKYDLSPRTFIAFWGQFKPIDEDSSLREEDKFQYLLKTLVDGSKAKKIAEGYPPSAENYKKVIANLRNRFGRETDMIELYTRDLINLVINKGQCRSISSLYDNLNTNIRALESLGIYSNKFEAVLYPLVQSTLPAEIAKSWERQRLTEENDGPEDGSVLSTRQANPLRELMRFLEQEVLADERIQFAKGTRMKDNEVRSTAAALVTTSETATCCFCKGGHEGYNCKKEMPLHEREGLVKKAGCCLRCLRRGHRVKDCRVKVTCSICQKMGHLAQMHRNFAAPVPVPEQSSSLFVGPDPKSTVILQTFLARICNYTVRVIFDSGSHRSYVSTELVDKLKLKRVGEESFKHVLFGGNVSELVTHGLYELPLRALEGEGSFLVKALGQDRICGPIPTSSKVIVDQLKRAGVVVRDDPNKAVEVLLGADVMASLLVGMKSFESLLAFETRIGWCLLGCHKERDAHIDDNVHCMLSTGIPSLWDLETLGIVNDKVLDEALSIEEFKQSIQISDSGRYSVKLPWIDGHPPLPTEYEMSKLRLSQVVKRLERNRHYELYDAVFQSWEQDGIIERIDGKEISGHYLPHRPVIKGGKTTKVRPVFDASAKAFGTVSLNECLHVGPNLLSDLFSLLMRFRLEEVGIVADIRQAFLMIELSELSDRDMLRFLWMRNGELITFRHCRVVFGLSPSPFILNATLSHHLAQFECQTAEILRRSFYVDDCVVSLPSLSQSVQFKRETCAMLETAGFEIRNWLMTGDDMYNHSVLGIRWDPKDDLVGCFKPKIEVGCVINKRELLSIIGKIYDPLGYLASPLLYLKLKLQECFKLKLSWDDSLPAHINEPVINWLREISLIDSIKIHRPLKTNDACNLELHVFSDASKVGMGVVIFLRYFVNNVIYVSFVTSKSRVSPIESMTIPRLELMAASLAARLGKNVSDNLCVNNVTYWSDSMIALYWIKKGEWKTFVGNRVKEIRRLTDSQQWKFVDGTKNPADLPSRGCFLSEYLTRQWWEGPSWLREPESQWSTVDIVPTADALAEQRVSLVNTRTFDNSPSLELFTYFDSFHKNVRLLAWLCRFVNKCRKSSLESGNNLSIDEVKTAEIKLIQYLQFTYLSDIKDIDVFRDTYGLVRAKSRVLSNEFCPMFKEPILLPDCKLTEALIRETHVKSHHAGVGIVLNILRDRYWILRGRRLARKVIKACIMCRRMRAKMVETPPVGLPHSRCNLGKAFQVTGCDLAGPLFLKDESKVWIVLFTCAVYRGVHFELVDSLSTESFLLALRRFIARRGKVDKLITDNGSNFHGAWNLISKVEVEEASRLKWTFNVPTAAWWGGFFERMVRTMKDLLKATLGRALLTFIELSTVLTEIESVINSRPITYDSDDPSELRPICPLMFLQEEASVNVPELDKVDKDSLCGRLRYVGEVRRNLKIRFKNEYLGSLLLAKGKIVNNVRVGELVFLQSDEKKRVDWDLARVMDVYKGKDGVVRSVKLKTARGEYFRPVQRICRLEIDEGLENSSQVTKNACVEMDRSIVDDSDIVKLDESKITRSGRIVKTPLKLNL